jgi:hypothetical protein
MARPQQPYDDQQYGQQTDSYYQDEYGHPQQDGQHYDHPHGQQQQPGADGYYDEG